MSDLHIAEFYQDVARILTALYGVFPRPVTLYVEDISGPDEPDEYGVHSPRHQACFAALLWMGEEGYLRFEEAIKQEALDQAVLTGRCFSALSALCEPHELDGSLPPSVASERSTLAYRLREAVYQKDSAALLTVVRPLIEKMAAH